MLAILAPVIVFGLVIFVHELGHFLAAKLVGVYAPRFSIGFGPSLWHRRWGETEYVVGALPLGGYVRMASRLDEDMALIEGGSEEKSARSADDPDFDPNAMMPFGPKPVPADRLFENKPLWGRLLIMIAGVTMNVVLSVVVLSIIAWHLGRPLIQSRVVGTVQADSGLAALRVIQPGDTIQAVNGKAVRTWNEVQRAITASTDTVRLTTQRGDVRQPLGGQTTAGRVADAIAVRVPPVLDSVVADYPAAKAGLRAGDSIVAVAGSPVYTWSEVVDRVSSSPGKPVPVVVARGAARESLTVVPKPTEEPDENGEPHTVGKVGVGVRDISVREAIGPAAAVGAGVRGSVAMAGEVVGIVRKLFSGRVSVKQLGGPVAITRASVQAARSGLTDLFLLIAFLSVNVAVLNLLPIPILDGGQIVINVVESAKGSPLSLRARENLLRFGLAAIALIFLLVMYNDTRQWLAQLFTWVARLFG